MAILQVFKGRRYTLDGAIRYITDEAKHDERVFYYGTAGILDSYDPYREMQMFKWAYGKMGGLQYRQIMISFTEGETSSLPPEYFIRPIVDIANMFFINIGVQIVYAIHCNTTKIHAHFILNSVSRYGGQKIDIDKQMIFSLKVEANKILQKYGLKGILMHSIE